MTSSLRLLLPSERSAFLLLHQSVTIHYSYVSGLCCRPGFPFAITSNIMSLRCLPGLPSALRPSITPSIPRNEMTTATPTIATPTLPFCRVPLLPLEQASIRWALIGTYIFQFLCLACFSDFTYEGCNTSAESGGAGQTR